MKTVNSPERPATARCPAALRALRGLWLVVGLTLLVFILAEVSLRGVFLLREALWPWGRYVDPHWASEVFANSSWISAYVDEFTRSRRFEWRPYVIWRARPFAGELINIDSGGIRRSWSRACGANRAVRRVFMFGGSALWGTGARDNFTIPSVVARKLAERGHTETCVVNWGESGYVSTQELIALVSQLRNGHVPDIAVFYDGVNDIVAAAQVGVAGHPQNEFNRRAEFNLTQRGGEMIARGLTVALKASAVYRLARKVRSAVLGDTVQAQQAVGETDEKVRAEQLADAAVETYLANADIVRTLARQYGFRPLFYWQPVAFVSKRLTTDETMVARHAPAWAYAPDAAYFERVIQVAYARVAQDERLRRADDFRDLSGIFSDVATSIYFDFVHVSEAGNEAVAEEIARDLARLIDTGGPPVSRHVSQPQSNDER